MSDSQIKTIEKFFHLMAQPAQTAALNSALRLGVIDALSSGQKTVTELADECSINRIGTEALLQVLVEAGLVEQFQEQFALSQAGRLTPMTLWAIVFEQWTHLESALRTSPDDDDEPEYERQRRLEKRRQRFKVIHSQVQWAATGVSLKVAEVLGIGSDGEAERKSLHVLDLGCGAAVYSMTMAHRDPGTIVKLVDGSIGLARARATINSLDVETRIEMLESDDLDVRGHDGTFDLALLADQVHLMSDEQLDQVLATAFRTLVEGGELAIVDIFPGQDRGKTSCSLFELQLLTGTGRNALRLDRLNEKLEQAGFRKIQFAELPVAPFTHGLVLASRP